MREKLRRKVSCYLPKELAVRFQEQAARQGISLSAYLVRTLAVEDQIDELQQWLASRFDRIDERLNQPLSEDRLLTLAGLDQVPRDLLLAVLGDLKEELAVLTPKQREHYMAKGRELLAKANGAAK
jgi:hypothetical protein